MTLFRKHGRRYVLADDLSHLEHFEPHCMLIAAARYYTGRMTIQSASFARELAAAWPTIPLKTRNILRRDLSEAFQIDDEARRRGSEHKPLGMDCDRAAWDLVRQAWRKNGEADA